MIMNYKDTEALRYHSMGKPGKIEITPTKPHSTQKDLSLAYSPGVAVPCLKIQENQQDVYKYTNKGNLVAVISNGTAVLGLGNIGAMSGKPVIEGKCLLFKICAGVDAYDIEINETDPDKFIAAVKAIAPTFGGINLEDIKAPECFEIERRLKAELDIPVMHDDQHGTAIISSAGLINACEIAGKKLDDVRLVISGAGAAAIACTRLYVSLGVRKDHILMLDHLGVITDDRENLTPQKKEFATSRKDVHTLKEAMKDADVFVGLSKAGVLTKEMVKTMADKPIIFALANPDPEITYEDALEARPDVIMSTGRSDYPNQINNLTGFPHIFRGALDVRASEINDAMKIAAAKAIASFVKDDELSPDYIIPSALDRSVAAAVAAAVAQAARDTGAARL
jgi:malate dehydrogenase (oxaloacetate-decarboxylating)(NADP+)